MRYNVPGTVVGSVLGIALGHSGYGVTSLIIMYLSTQFIQSITLWMNSKWRPSLSFSKNRLWFHLDFGYKLMLSSVIDTVFKNIYNIVIGKFYSTQDLGFYERARAFKD